jgi:LuxR family maltose regulon positive regulatory protein
VVSPTGVARSAPGLVARDELHAALSAAGPGRVALVCAPAGSGKTMLLRSWVESAGLGKRTAWVAVGRGERDAQRFWLSVIDRLAAASGDDGPVERLSATPAFDGAAAVERLAEQLQALAEPVVLVIDDLHELHSADALAWLERFLGEASPRVAIVLSSREEPRLGLHRLRLAGDLIELRGGDLRFTPEDTRDLLRASGVTLSDAGADLLHERTEGWAAGLRLAALSLAGRPDPERFVSEFSGSERTVAGYLLAEVLERQPTEVRELLLRTSVLERVSGALADELTGGSGSEAILQGLEEANAFVSALDAGRSWFRFHALFADLLRLELRRTSPGSIESLHRAAAGWFDREGHVVEAIRHAQAAGDWARATRLLADNYPRLGLSGQLETFHALLDAFPAGACDTDPEFAILVAADRLSRGRPDETAAYLTLAERLAPAVDDERRRPFDLLLGSVRLAAARRRGDLGAVLEAMKSLEAALDALRGADIGFATDLRATALMDLGVAELWSLELDDARRHLEQALELARRIERPYVEIGCLGHLAMAAVLSARPADVAVGLAEQAAAIAEAHGWTTDPIAATTFAVGGNLLVRLARFTTAELWLERAEQALGPGEPGTDVVLHSARGLLHLARGRPEDALAAFRAGLRTQALLAGQHALTSELRSRVLQTQVRLGEVAAAREALAALPKDERDVAGARIAAAVVHLAGGELQRVVDELAPVIAQEMPTLHLAWGAMEASLLDAVARERLGDQGAAEASIERALALAEPEGMLLPFLIFPVRELLERHPRRRTAHASLVTTILDVLDGAAAEPTARPAQAFEELSDAELRVLRYLPSNLKSPEIAAELFVSTNTVRTHVRHIYAKLDAHSRTEAVARARELGLLARGGR